MFFNQYYKVCTPLYLFYGNRLDWLTLDHIASRMAEVPARKKITMTLLHAMVIA